MSSMANNSPITSSYVLQNKSKQDVALNGSTDEFDYLIASDGHGGDSEKHMLRDLFNSLDWSSILQNENWYKNDMNENGDYISPLFTILHNSDAFSSLFSTHVGCTLSVSLIYPDRFECFTIGDSSIKIWEKNEEWSRVFVSVDHDINFTDVSKLEVRDDALFCRRTWLIKNGINLSNIRRLKVINTNTMSMEPSAYFNFDDGSKLNMTRALGHYPSTSVTKKAKDLSGGQMQRVAIAKAFIANAELLLLDEPFSNLDTVTKSYLVSDLKHLIKAQNASAIVVVHHPEDALEIADEIMVLDNGQIAQHASPHYVYEKPKSKTVAST